MSNADIRGRFVWHDLMTTDIKAAGAFYPKFRGWKTQAGEKDPSYIMWVTAKGPFGGIRALPEAARASGSHWLPYIGTPDLDATLQSAQGLGARVYMGATEVPDTGRFAVLADPQGAVFALFTPAATTQSGGSSSMPQEFSWHELATSDPIGALHFYGELFGWREVATHAVGDMGTYHLLGLGDTASIGMWKPTADMPVPTRWLSYVQIPDIDKSVSAAKAVGAKVLNGPMEVPGGTWIAHLTDPQGAPFALHATQRVAAALTSKVAAPKSAPTTPPRKPEPPTLKARPASSAVAAAPPKVQAPATVSAAVKKPAAAKKSAAKRAPVKKAAAKKAPAKKKTVAKKAVAKKSPGKKRRQQRARAVAKQGTRKAAVKRKSAKKKGKSASRRAAPGNFEIARRFAAKQADSLIKRLRGKKHR